MTTVINCKHVEPEDLPENYVFIGRPTRWGNPFRIRNERRLQGRQQGVAPEFIKDTRAEAIEAYREWVLKQPQFVAAIRRELKDKVLGCYCKPLSCHGDVLAEIANGS